MAENQPRFLELVAVRWAATAAAMLVAMFVSWLFGLSMFVALFIVLWTPLLVLTVSWLIGLRQRQAIEVRSRMLQMVSWLGLELPRPRSHAVNFLLTHRPNQQIIDSLFFALVNGNARQAVYAAAVLHQYSSRNGLQSSPSLIQNPVPPKVAALLAIACATDRRALRDAVEAHVQDVRPLASEFALVAAESHVGVRDCGREVMRVTEISQGGSSR